MFPKLLKRPAIFLLLTTFISYFGFWYLVWSTGINPLGLQSEDVIPTSIQPLSILIDRTLYLDSYYNFMIDRYPHPDDKNFTKGFTPYYLRSVGKSAETHYLSAFTLPPALLALPFYVPFTLGLQITWTNIIVISHVAAAFLMSISTVLFYVLISNYFSLDKSKSILLSLVFAFGTINFSMFSQALWQHGIVGLFSISALVLIYKYSETSKIKSAILVGTLLGLAFLTRPTALLIFFYLGLLLLSTSRDFLDFAKRGLLYLFGFLVPVGIFLHINKVFYSSIENQGYASQLMSWYSKFPEGFLGMWISPSKGILVYSPVLIFSLFGAYIVFKDKKSAKFEKFQYFIFFAIVLTHTLILSIWKHWYGGYSYGYRMAGDIVPFLSFLIIPYLKSSFFEQTKKIFYSLTVISFFIHLSGLVFFDGIWHGAYDEGYINTQWLWSIKDSEFAFNIRRVLVKLDLLDKACPKCLPK